METNLIEIKNKLSNFIEKYESKNNSSEEIKKNKDDFIENLYKLKFDEKWFIAQCKSLDHRISETLEENSNFNEKYNKLITKIDRNLLIEELVFDANKLNQISKNKLAFENHIITPNYIHSHQFFLNAKFSYFSKKNFPEITGRNFKFSIIPFLIRQAIEIKLKNMIGIASSKKKNGDDFLLNTSKLISFIEKNPKLFELPVETSTLTKINKWTNSFIHTGNTPFCWQSLNAIDLIEPLFSTENPSKPGIISIIGFNYIRDGVGLAEIKEALDKEFSANFVLSDKYIESTIN